MKVMHTVAFYLASKKFLEYQINVHTKDWKLKESAQGFEKKRGCQSLLSLYKTQPIFKAYFKGKKVSHILENSSDEINH